MHVFKILNDVWHYFGRLFTVNMVLTSVTSRVGLWFADHSTPNPLGVVPDERITKIVKGNKFDHEGSLLVVTEEESHGKK